MLDECVKVAGVAPKCSSVNDLGVIDDITALAKSSNVYQFKTAIRVNGQEYFNGMKLNFNQNAFDTKDISALIPFRGSSCSSCWKAPRPRRPL